MLVTETLSKTVTGSIWISSGCQKTTIKRQPSYLATGSNSIPWYISGKRPLQIK